LADQISLGADGAAAPAGTIAAAGSVPTAVVWATGDPTVDELLDLVAAFEARFNSMPDDSITVTVSTDRAIMESCGFSAGSTVPTPFMDRVQRGLDSGNWQQEGLVVPPKSAANLTGLLRAHLAPRTPFAGLLRRLLKAGGLSYAVVAQRCGRRRRWIDQLLSRRHGGVTGISLNEALVLDQTLKARGMLFAAYLAQTQSGAFELYVPAIDQVLGWNSFARKLVQGRQARGFSLRAAVALAGIPIDASVLSYWEQGFHLPSLDFEPDVVRLDGLYGADRGILEAWKAEKPRKSLDSYAWSCVKWGPDLQGQ